MDFVGLTSYLIKSLVKDPESVSVKQFETEDDTILIEVLVNSDEIGAVIGKNGKIANSIRTIVQASSYLNGNKIYLLDIEVAGKNGLELARKIRKTGDWTSPIIIVTSHEEFKQVGYTAKILMLNFITKNEELEKDLYETLEVALEINMSKKSLCYTNKGELYHIPYQDILYIEKSLNDNICNVFTKNDIYSIRKTIIDLEKTLSDDINFVKTHRSCIVNLKNIKYVDFENNIITFVNKEIDLLSRAHKKQLKERMKEM